MHYLRQKLSIARKEREIRANENWSFEPNLHHHRSAASPPPPPRSSPLPPRQKFMCSSMGSKRQLPPWMLRAPATDQLKSLVSEVKNQENGLEELSTDPELASTCQSESTKADSCMVKKCQTTRSRRKLVKQAGDDVSDNMHEDYVEKENYAPPRRSKHKAKDLKATRSKVVEESTFSEDDVEKENYAPRRKRKAKDLKATRSKVVEESTFSEDEFGVDDLISIAKEYINADKRKEVQRSSLAECELERQPQSISSEDKTAHKDNNTPSSATTLEASSSDLVECQPSERGGDAISFPETEDVAQDVIELILGPLFKRRNKAKPNPEQ